MTFNLKAKRPVAKRKTLRARALKLARLLAQAPQQLAHNSDRHTWKAATDAAMDGGGGSDNKELDRRVKQGACRSQVFRHQPVHRSRPEPAAAVPDALDSMNCDIRAGLTRRSGRQGGAHCPRKTAAKKTSGGQPTAAFPSFQ